MTDLFDVYNIGYDDYGVETYVEVNGVGVLFNVSEGAKVTMCLHEDQDVSTEIDVRDVENPRKFEKRVRSWVDEQRT